MAPWMCSSLTTTPPSNLFITADHSLLLSMLDRRCSTMRDLESIHAHLIKTGIARHTFVASRLLAFCTSPAGDINYAHALFSRIEEPNLFVWNTMIRGFSKSAYPERAILLFIDMLIASQIQPQRLTYPSVFRAYAQLGLAGRQLHGSVIKLGLEDDPFVRNTIVHMYASCGFLGDAHKVFDESSNLDTVGWNSMIMGLAKCGQIDESRRLFDKTPMRNTITWNSMLSGYVRNGRFTDALQLFDEMQRRGVQPTEFTIVTMLNASAGLGALRQGEWLHDYIIKNELELNSIITTALIDMYSRCGSINKAFEVFQATPKKGLSCWNSMILGLARNSYEEEALLLFSELESSNLKPDSVTFIGVLTACNHGGLIDPAVEYFHLMTEKYRIFPSLKHYSCLIDLLGRLGFIQEAEELIRTMPFEPDEVIWGSLLFSCWKHKNGAVAEKAAKKMMELDPNETSTYVIMSNVHAACWRFEEALEQRASMKEMGIGKEPGCSSIEVDGEVHEFTAGRGWRHPRSEEIYGLLQSNKLSCIGLVPWELDNCLLDIKKMAAGNQTWAAAHVLRGANSVAHSLAKEIGLTLPRQTHMHRVFGLPLATYHATLRDWSCWRTFTAAPD